MNHDDVPSKGDGAGTQEHGDTLTELDEAVEELNGEEATSPPNGRAILTPRAIRKRIKRRIWWAGTNIGKRSTIFRRAVRHLLRVRRAADYRRICRHNPVDDKTVVFNSFMGRRYSDNPKAIYKAMLADPRFDDFTFVWAFRRPGRYAEEPELARATIVRYRSRNHFTAYARAKYWISNSINPSHIDTRDGQILLQAWHGTPLKRVGCDLAGGTVNPKYSVVEVVERYRREGQAFTYLVSPSAYASEKLASAFCLSPEVAAKKILEEGYPRNDALLTFSSADVERIRTELEIPQGKKVVLYAPTWRDDQHTTGVGYTFDLPVDFEYLKKTLGDEYVILFRAHYFIGNRFDFEHYDGFVIDVSKAPDINDLYIVSDMLVTDYSSVCFDYANLERPIVFYMYDLEEYASETRGFYLTLDELPGPIVQTEEELISAICSADKPTEELATRYRLFNERFNYLDDGHASERVIDRIMEVPRATASD